MKKLLVVAALAFVIGWFLSPRRIDLRAQTPPVQYFAPAPGSTVANCGTPASGFPLCGVATGWFVWNGTAWVQLGVPVVAGVTSWNGQVGVVTYTPPAPPVTSVNGKVGAIVITAVTSAPTTTLQ